MPLGNAGVEPLDDLGLSPEVGQGAARRFTDSREYSSLALNGLLRLIGSVSRASFICCILMS